MHTVGLKVLKNRLSEYVCLAARGETVLVTDRDQVVAEIVPPREGRSPLAADARLAEAVRKGWITPPALAGTGVEYELWTRMQVPDRPRLIVTPWPSRRPGPAPSDG